MNLTFKLDRKGRAMAVFIAFALILAITTLILGTKLGVVMVVVGTVLFVAVIGSPSVRQASTRNVDLGDVNNWPDDDPPQLSQSPTRQREDEYDTTEFKTVQGEVIEPKQSVSQGTIKQIKKGEIDSVSTRRSLIVMADAYLVVFATALVYLIMRREGTTESVQWLWVLAPLFAVAAIGYFKHVGFIRSMSKAKSRMVLIKTTLAIVVVSLPVCLVVTYSDTIEASDAYGWVRGFIEWLWDGVMFFTQTPFYGLGFVIILAAYRVFASAYEWYTNYVYVTRSHIVEDRGVFVKRPSIVTRQSMLEASVKEHFLNLGRWFRLPFVSIRLDNESEEQAIEMIRFIPRKFADSFL